MSFLFAINPWASCEPQPAVPSKKDVTVSIGGSESLGDIVQDLCSYPFRVLFWNSP